MDSFLLDPTKQKSTKQKRPLSFAMGRERQMNLGRNTGQNVSQEGIAGGLSRRHHHGEKSLNMGSAGCGLLAALPVSLPFLLANSGGSPPLGPGSAL